MPAQDASANVVHFSMPKSQDEAIPEGYFAEGEAVVYHSRTQSAYLRARITKIHILAGVVQAIDLSCKKSADLTKIAKIQDEPWRESVLAELPLPLHAENAERRQGDTAEVPLADTNIGDANSLRLGSEVLRKTQPETQSPSIRFKVGDKVLYNSRSLNQKIVAVVERITSDGHYDLDVKKSADPKNLSLYIESPTWQEHEAAQLPLNVRADSGTPHSGTPRTFANAAEFVASRHTGQGRLLSCRTSQPVPLTGQVLAEAPSPLNNAEIRRVDTEVDVGMHDDGVRIGSKVLQTIPGHAVHAAHAAHDASPGGRFRVGDKVFYNSRSLNQKMVAVVEGITSDGHYDLDVKKSADPKNLSPYVEPPTAVQLPFQLVRSEGAGVGVGTPQDNSTPRGFGNGAAEFVAKRYTGEGRIVSCKAFAAVPIGPQVPSPNTRTPTPVRAGAKSFFLPGSTPRVCAAPKAPNPVVTEMIRRLCGEIRCADRFKPSLGTIRQQLLQQLGLTKAAQIKEMGGFKGGLNQGIWIVSDNGQKLVLKQSRCQRIASNILTEAENFVRILKDHPETLGERFR
ncbi:unnamed protein product [Cladocopium goreaui]|uniref:Uncharacterized protein n=1 Tax=Cladocopium goreaui TaxID=2562237 RepID=A0A9P1BJN8_9DINO|nr:unnamed protein product [Cladocopium goreaui]